MSREMTRLGGILSGEGKVVLFLAVSLLVAEGVMRLGEKRLSKDIEHIRSIPRMAEEMRAHNGKKILFIGNSLTRCAIDPDIIRDAVVKNGARNPRLFFFYPDATSAANWDYGFRRYFLNAGCLPDEVFIGTGPRHLADRYGGDAARLGAFYVPRDQVVRALTHDTPAYEQKGEFLLARLSILYASRSKVKPRILGPLIPDYFDMEQWVNTQRDSSARDAALASDTFEHLDALLALLKKKRIPAHVFTIPQPKPYALEPSALRVMSGRGTRLHELANVPGITPVRFKDGYHLDAEGAAIFSRALAADQ